MEEPMMGRRPTREIAIYNEGRLDARIEADREHHARVEKALSDSKADRERMHGENKADNASLNAKFDAVDTKINTEITGVHKRIDGMIWKIVGWQTLVIAGLLAVGGGSIGWLVTQGPWAPHH